MVLPPVGTRLRGHGRGRLASVPRGARARQRRAPDAPARLRRLPRTRSPLAGGTRLVLGCGGRGHGARVLSSVGGRRRPLARPRVGDLVRRRAAQHRAQLRPSLGGADSRDRGLRLARRGRRPPHDELRGALRRGHAPRGGSRRARRRGRRPCGDLPADVAGGRGRFPRLRPPGSDPGADLLRIRRARRRAAAPGVGGEGGDHHDDLAPSRARGADARDPGGGPHGGADARARRGRAVGRPAGRAAGLLAARGARLGDAVPAHLHLGHDRHARRASSTSRAASSSRSRGRSATRPTRGPAT